MKLAQRFFRAGTAALFAAVVAAVPAAAQEQEMELFIPGHDPSVAPLDLTRRVSPFNLRAEGDEGYAAPRSSGDISICFSNHGISPYFTRGCRTTVLALRPDGLFDQSYFDLKLAFAAPASDLPPSVDRQASGLRGDGYTFITSSFAIQPIGGGNKLWASDRTGRELLNFDALVTSDGECTDRTSTRAGLLVVGFTLLPQSDCPPTIPREGWMGRQVVPLEGYLAAMELPGFESGDPFAFWRVPPELQRSGFIGNWQTYGEFSDHYFQARPRYGAVLPGGTGPPSYHGWPLSVTVFFDAFYFALPTLNSVVFWQATIVNDSREHDVWGPDGATYDSLYVAVMPDPNGAALESHYLDPARNAWMYARTGSGCVGKTVMPGSSGCGNVPFDGFDQGGNAVVVLKSPIGDTRYKLFSDPSSDLFEPEHDLAGDTITVNHQHMCGFGSCYQGVFQRSMRSAFGMLSSRTADVLDGRDPASLTDNEFGQIFRPANWPQRTGFNKYVPGVGDSRPIWDYNKDGIPDTIYADSCGDRGCVEVFGDTLPGGWVNSFGNVGALTGAGPFRLAPGDTVALVLAFVAGSTQGELESNINNAIAFYNNFYLGPEPAPPPVIVAVDVRTGSVRTAQVKLFLDNTTEDWVDPFLASLDVSGDLELNPWIADSIADRAGNNVAAYHIFKSCDGGTTWTSDTDCDGDPVNAVGAKFSGVGWEPYETIEASATGELPNIYTDTAVTAGITYTYAVVTETRGATFNVVRGEPGDFTAETVEFGPSLLGALTASPTNPNVARVYVPLNLAAGAQPAGVEIVSVLGRADVPFNVDLIGTTTQAGQFRVLYVDSLVVTTITHEGDVPDSTTVDGFLLRTVTGPTGGAQRVAIQQFTFTREGTVSTSGLGTPTSTTTGGRTVTVARGRGGIILLAADGDRPLLVSTTLTPTGTTPGDFIGSPDFPFFTISVDTTVAGRFNQQVFVRPSGDTLAARVSPAGGGGLGVVWRTAAGMSRPLPESDFGRLELTWAADAFGPSAPLNLQPLATLAERVAESLASRAVASRSSTDPAHLEAVLEADTALTISAEDLVSFALPFTVRNLSYDREVFVVVTGHQESLLIGAGADTVRVDVPNDLWVPGDTAYLVERVTREVRDEQGRVVLDASGQPQTEEAFVATFKMVLGCGTAHPRLSCDPTVGGTSVYNPVPENTRHLVHYYIPLSGGEEIRFAITPAVNTGDVAAGEGNLNLVHVVPNPYIFFSQFERATTERVIKFTNLPPRGRIRIFDVAGRFIQQLDYETEDLQAGDLSWNLQTREGLELAYGLYVFVLESEGRRRMGKFVVIR